MIKAGERVKIIGISRRDAGYHRRKTLVGQNATVGDEGLAQWKDNKCFYGPVLLDNEVFGEGSRKDFWFHSCRVKILPKELPNENSVV